MKKVKINKISRTGKSYKLGVDPNGYLQLIRTTENDPDALSIIRKGTDAFYCPLCGRPECIKQIDSIAQAILNDMHIDLSRSLYREIRLCTNNKDSARNKENICKVIESHKREDVIRLIEKQRESFYLIENFSFLIISPPFTRRILCPSCGSHNFHDDIYPHIMNKEFQNKSIKCSSCSMLFYVHRFFSAMMFIIDQLYRNPGGIFIVPFGEKIKHVFFNYPYSVTVKIENDRTRIFNYPTDYMKLPSPMLFEEVLAIFCKFGKKGEWIERTSSGERRADAIDAKLGLKSFRLFFPKNVEALVRKVAKRDFDNSLVVFIFSGTFKQMWSVPPAPYDDFFLRIASEEWLSWVDIYGGFLNHIKEKNKIADIDRTHRGSYVLSSPCYPTQINNSADWMKNTWDEILTNDIIISPLY